MLRTAFSVTSLLPLACLLAGCGRPDVSQRQEPIDPVVVAALADPLMTDPDLSSQNHPAAALAVVLPETLIPLDRPDAASRDAARADVAALLGAEPSPAPPAQPGDGAKVSPTALLSWRQAFPGDGCANKASWTFGWAAKMPAAFPIYPRGHVQEAAGVEDSACRLRAVNFRSGVSTDDVLAFYAAMARRAGMTLVHKAGGESHQLAGSKGSAGYAVYVRPGAEGLTEVDLVTRGF